MSKVNDASQDERAGLSAWVDKVDADLIEASKLLRSIDEKNDNLERVEYLFQHCCETKSCIVQYETQLEYWYTLTLSAYHQSELNRSRGQLKRLTLLIKNLERICMRYLGIPNPESDLAGLF